MDMCHQELRLADEFTVLLPLDGPHSDGTAFIDIESVGLTGVHFGMGSAVTVERALADLRVDAPWNEECDADVVIFQFQGLVKPE